MPRPSQKFVVGLVDGNGEAILDVADIGKLEEGDEVEFVSGSLDVTIAFAGAQIFGQDKYRLPSNVNSKSLKVLATAPQSSQEPYTITDEESGETFRRLNEPAAQPVMIFGP
jgi:hypothetical protein